MTNFLLFCQVDFVVVGNEIKAAFWKKIDYLVSAHPKGTFFNYVDNFLTYFDPLPPIVDIHWHFGSKLPNVTIDILENIPSLSMYLILISTSYWRLWFTIYCCHQKIDKAKIYLLKLIELLLGQFQSIQNFEHYFIAFKKQCQHWHWRNYIPGYLALTFVDKSSSTPSLFL